MGVAEARTTMLVLSPEYVASELRPSELEHLELLSEDEVTTLLQRRFRRYLADGCDHRRALMLAVGLV